MFTEFARQQQPYQVPHSLPPFHNAPGLFNLPPHLFPTMPSRTVDSKDAARGTFAQRSSQRLSTPTQPLQDPSFRLGGHLRAIPLPAPADNSEHILRRKTPNGTLAAGYDGTPVNWVSRPHVNKHILMPASEVAQCSPYQTNTPFNPPLLNRPRTVTGLDAQRNSSWTNPVSSQQNGYSFNASGADAAKLRHSSIAAFPPSLDSMLHQAPSPQQYYNQAGMQQVAYALQSMWPPSIGPTASNAQGPYGPYWPHGSFEPYRPAALRDHRFQSQFANISLNDPFEGQPLPQEHVTWPADILPNTPLPGFDYSANAPWSARRFGVQPVGNPLLKDNSGIHVKSPFDSLGLDNHRLNHGPFTPRQSLAPTTIASSEWASFPPPRRPFSFPQNGFPDRNHPQFKERVLLRAHRIYSDLISSIHQSRKLKQRNRQSVERYQSQATIFPKLPQPSTPIAANAVDVSPGAGLGVEERSKDESQIAKLGSKSIQDDRSNQQSALDGQNGFEWPHPMNSTGRLERANSVANCTGRPPLHQPRHPFSGHRNPEHAGSLEPYSTPVMTPIHQMQSPTTEARAALEMLAQLAQESGWKWIDGLLLGGCLAYGLADYDKALQWYARVLACEPNNVEAISNMAATLLSLGHRKDAEEYWLRSVKLRPSYFEAVEHLVGLLSGDQRGRDAVQIIEFVENALRKRGTSYIEKDARQEIRSVDCADGVEGDNIGNVNSTCNSSYGTSQYLIPASDHGRILTLVHAKGNMLYGLGDNAAAAKTFEDAIMIAVGGQFDGIAGLIKQILLVFAEALAIKRAASSVQLAPNETILLLPKMALKTALLLFPTDGQLPGLRDVQEGHPKKSAISVMSNSLLSLAKIYQDGMSSNGSSSSGPKIIPGVQDILALYYLSLSLQPSPSTANNVGILLAGVQQIAPQPGLQDATSAQPVIPGVVPGSGIALALAYYNFGLNLDSRHAHLYTNLGSLLKDIGQLNAAIKMYEQAVTCDPNFDIALANLANAVKDQGRISDAISFYQRAVASNPDFAEAVCGLANALNSVCNWKHRGGIVYPDRKKDRWHVDNQGMLVDAKEPGTSSRGWIGRVVEIVEKQLHDGKSWGKGVFRTMTDEEPKMLAYLAKICVDQDKETRVTIMKAMASWAGQDCEGAQVVRMIERATKRLGWLIYQDKYVRCAETANIKYPRPQLPASLVVPNAPTVLPFHTFTCPLTAKQIRMISQRNGLRISCSTLRAAWLQPTMFDPPPPPKKRLKVGYVSSDFNNHPLAHLMQSVFGFHDPTRVTAYCYATTASDSSTHREQIQREAPVFHDASAWSVDQLVNQIVEDGIHILINLNGYTRGARNEVFAARPAPIQMSFMGFAGTLGAEWCDYLLADTTAVPPSTLRPYRRNVDLNDLTLDKSYSDEGDDWVYSENIIYTRDTFFCCDHRQSAPDSHDPQLKWPAEIQRRAAMRKELFPDLPSDAIILANFNQLYKIEPTIFRTWLRILQRLPTAYLWLLRFPDLGEQNLRATALAWATPSVASRILFTEVAPKHQHIARARVCDLFLDTPECNAHTTAADVLWSGTPLLTLPRYEYKMCSRMAASILRGALPRGDIGTEAWKTLTVDGEEAYENRAVALGQEMADMLRGDGSGPEGCRLLELRRLLYEGRWESPLFDTRRWVRDLEEAYEIAWDRWVKGEGGDIWL